MRKTSKRPVMVSDKDRETFAKAEMFFKRYHITRHALGVLREKIEDYQQLKLEEQRYALSPAEKEDFAKLSELFHNKSSPSIPITEALREVDELPRLDAEYKRAEKEYESFKSPTFMDTFSIVDAFLLASGAVFLPTSAAVARSFLFAGLAILIIGICMYIPLIYSHIERRADRKKNLKRLRGEMNEKEIRKNEIETNLEEIKKEYHLGTLKGAELKTQLGYLSPLAREYERIEAKKARYSKNAHPEMRLSLKEEIDELFMEDFGIRVSDDDYMDAFNHFSEMFEKYSAAAQKAIMSRSHLADMYLPPIEQERYEIRDAEKEEGGGDISADYATFRLSTG